MSETCILCQSHDEAGGGHPLQGKGLRRGQGLTLTVGIRNRWKGQGFEDLCFWT